MFGNLLNIAASAIPQQTVSWERFLSRSQDDRGRWVNIYADPEPVRGSFQPLDESDAKERGFDISRSYAALYTSHDMQNVQRGEAPDRVTYNGELYDVVGETDWYTQDGWKRVYCVKAEPL